MDTEKNIVLTAADVMDRWQMNEANFFVILRQKKLSAYSLNTFTPIDGIVGHLWRVVSPEKYKKDILGDWRGGLTDLKGRSLDNRRDRDWVPITKYPVTLDMIKRVLDSVVFLLRDVQECEIKYGFVAEIDVQGKVPTKQDQGTNEKLTDSNRALKPCQEDKNEARNIANRYIKDCNSKGIIPFIVDGVRMVKDEYLKNQYKDTTIHNWIKDLYPSESRKPGRRPNRQEGQDKIKPTK